MSVTFDPNPVDVTSGDVPVNVTIHVTDDLSGIDFKDPNRQWDSYLYISGPSPSSQYLYLWFSSFNRIDQNSGNLDTTWQGTLTVPQTYANGPLTASGTWMVNYIRIYDKAGNHLDLLGSGIEANPNVQGLEVIAPPPVVTTDTTPPEVVGIEFGDPPLIFSHD